MGLPVRFQQVRVIVDSAPDPQAKGSHMSDPQESSNDPAGVRGPGDPDAVETSDPQGEPRAAGNIREEQGIHAAGMGESVIRHEELPLRIGLLAGKIVQTARSRGQLGAENISLQAVVIYVLLGCHLALWRVIV